MKQQKEGPRWDDRVAIAIMVGTWILLGLAGLYINGWNYVQFLLG